MSVKDSDLLRLLLSIKSKVLIFFLEKISRAFVLQKLLTFFLRQINGNFFFSLTRLETLMPGLIMMLLVVDNWVLNANNTLNNWALHVKVLWDNKAGG